MVDLRVCVKKTLHGSVPIEGSYIKQHLSRVEGEEERAVGEEKGIRDPADTSVIVGWFRISVRSTKSSPGLSKLNEPSRDVSRHDDQRVL